MVAQAQCNTIETLRQVVEEHAGKLGAASRDAQSTILDVCSKFPEELTEHAYTHSAATLAEIGIALSLALMTEIAPIRKPLGAIEIRGQRMKMEATLRAQMEAAIAADNNLQENATRAVDHFNKEMRHAKRKALKSYLLYGLFVSRKWLALSGLSLSLYTLWLMAYGHAHSKDLVIGSAFLACFIQGLPLILLKNHKAVAKEKQDAEGQIDWLVQAANNLSEKVAQLTREQGKPGEQ